MLANDRPLDTSRSKIAVNGGQVKGEYTVSLWCSEAGAVNYDVIDPLHRIDKLSGNEYSLKR